MRRRITRAIVGVTAAVLIVLSVPLVIVARRSAIDAEVVELQAEAARALPEMATPLDPSDLQRVADEPDAPPSFQVYRTDGALLFGDGPTRPDGPTQRALVGATASSTNSGEIVVATPILEPGSETVVGVLRVTESLDGADRRGLVALGVIVGAGAAAILVAWFVARRLARRLSDPVVTLAVAAGQLGDGQIIDGLEPVGIDEIDKLGDAMVSSARQLHEALARERQFSSDVSHQLRTPLTGLRLKLEVVADHNIEALDDLSRIEDTVEHLLAYARGQMPQLATADLADTVERARSRWTASAVTAGRTLRVTSSPTGPVRAAPTSIDQILDVLIDNALRHGDGAVQLRSRAIAGGAALDVSDEGSSTSTSEDQLFARGIGINHGIGLAFARSLAEAEGGRLLRSSAEPTTFSLVLLAAEPAG